MEPEASYSCDIEVTMDQILSVFKNYSDKKKMRDIKTAVEALNQNPEYQSFFDNEFIDKQVETIIKDDIKQGDESFLVYSKGFYSKRKRKQPIGETPLQINDYTGRAGECAVMSELLFNQYNVNRMMIDDGVDLVTVKDNIYYYIQVKTVAMKDGKIIASIAIDNFDKFIGQQMRYVIVARCKDKETIRNVFFTFTQQEISKGIYDRCIKRGERNVSIKIKFHERSGEPIMYDERETNVQWNMNRFIL